MSRPAPLLHIRRSRPDASGRERLACLVLAALACVLAHELSYHLRYGSGARYSDAMRLWGHDGYWLALTTGVGLAAGILAWVAIRHLRRLHREAHGAPVTDVTGAGRTLGALTGHAWLRLAGLATLLFTLQENLEAILVGHPAPALAPLLGDGAVALVAIVGTSLLVAVVVALTRWRQLVLLGRIRARTHDWPRTRPARRPVTPMWVAPSDHLRGVRLTRGPPSVVVRTA
ncbi:MAG: hypothetical protein KF809_02185 [Chloroflexi bacterium]|nr:hypothetical protein [Chloroflexota bacterium]